MVGNEDLRVRNERSIVRNEDFIFRGRRYCMGNERLIYISRRYWWCEGDLMARNDDVEEFGKG
jgi:hypothetical protein